MIGKWQRRFENFLVATLAAFAGLAAIAFWACMALATVHFVTKYW